LYKPTLESSKN